MGKTLTTLELSRLPEPVRRQLPTLCEGHFVERGHNILAFGLPGRGKTHLLCATGQALIERGYRVFFTPAFKLVQRLLSAKHDLPLGKKIAPPQWLCCGHPR
jgi:DNA replication protein DnaC